MHAIQYLNMVSALQIHSHPILTASINTSSELILSPIFTSMQLPQFWHHPHQWDMVGNWKIINRKLYGEQEPAPESILECVHCKCQKGCKTRRCSCYKSDLKCTELFRCNSSENSDILVDELSTVFGNEFELEECDVDDDDY